MRGNCCVGDEKCVKIENRFWTILSYLKTLQKESTDFGQFRQN